ncbi:hypothetical protein HYDPIDRAFT_97559, partial [Hydnomerulius pinastri MD-312]
THSMAHPYWYAQVLGIYYADIQLLDGSVNFHTLPEPGYQAGLQTGQLPKVGFVPSSDPAVFRFLDLNLIICAMHLIVLVSKVHHSYLHH